MHRPVPRRTGCIAIFFFRMVYGHGSTGTPRRQRSATGNLEHIIIFCTRRVTSCRAKTMRTTHSRSNRTTHSRSSRTTHHMQYVPAVVANHSLVHVHDEPADRAGTHTHTHTHTQQQQRIGVVSMVSTCLDKACRCAVQLARAEPCFLCMHHYQATTYSVRRYRECSQLRLCRHVQSNTVCAECKRVAKARAITSQIRAQPHARQCLNILEMSVVGFVATELVHVASWAPSTPCATPRGCGCGHGTQLLLVTVVTGGRVHGCGFEAARMPR
jgi:hypothetical protein